MILIDLAALIVLYFVQEDWYAQSFSLKGFGNNRRDPFRGHVVKGEKG